MHCFKSIIISYLKGLLHLFYPSICLQCGDEPSAARLVLCEKCFNALPFTDFFLIDQNPLEKIFWGRITLHHAGAALFFTKDSIVQLLIYELKYKKNKKAGWLLGNIIGHDLLKATLFHPIDFLVPIPLNKKRERDRGFNQSLIICEGIVEVFPLPILNTVLVKHAKTKTQTNKDRVQRGQVAVSPFLLKFPYLIFEKHLLLVDDVVTTGATVEAACKCLSLGKPKSIQLAAGAYTLS